MYILYTVHSYYNFSSELKQTAGQATPHKWPITNDIRTRWMWCSVQLTLCLNSVSAPHCDPPTDTWSLNRAFQLTWRSSRVSLRYQFHLISLPFLVKMISEGFSSGHGSSTPTPVRQTPECLDRPDWQITSTLNTMRYLELHQHCTLDTTVLSVHNTHARFPAAFCVCFAPCRAWTVLKWSACCFMLMLMLWYSYISCIGTFSENLLSFMQMRFSSIKYA